MLVKLQRNQTAGENIKWYNQRWKTISYKTKHALPCDPAIAVPGIYPEK